MTKVKLYDTTLRDGSQGEGISFSVEDKLNIVRKLDLLGIHYIEGGWPGSNPKDMQFFSQVKKLNLKNSKITAFGSTRRPQSKASADPNIKALLKTGTNVVTIFGKSWNLHVKDILRTTLKENLKMIKDTVSYLSGKGLEVIYDAEHFFDGYQANPSYSLDTLLAAQEAGCRTIVLCDTNGGMITSRLREIITDVISMVNVPLGIHTHNDSGMAVANSIAACQSGCRHVQGTINGYGERCGNANLCSVIPNLKLKMDLDCISDKKLKDLTEVARFVAETANMVLENNQPFVGKSAFSHKGGIHVNAVMKKPLSYEHIEPSRVGNKRRMLISELSGQSNVLIKAKQMEIDLQKGTPQTKKILNLLQDLEHKGYQFEAAEASFELLMKKALAKYKKFFELEGFKVLVEKKNNKLISEATIKLKVKGVVEHTAAEGDGPVNALDKALRKALSGFYPALSQMHLSDFKVRVLNAETGTAAKVRVLIQSQDSKDSWSTVGVHENIIEASWQALVDSVEYKLLKNKA
ncbi:MAG: citramalate synthase [Candidatus Omnitrophota bacterium]|nr:citramalate synthase [Candidatus Omnitrophota bacterium]